MSLVWMTVVACLIAFEKLIPSRRVATLGTAGVLLGLGALLAVAPDALPGLTIPSGGSMGGMG
jgi:predicted metal-binding membrane protein